MILATVVTILLVSLACSIGTDQSAQDDLQSTIVALEITKIFLENQPIQEPPPPIVQTEPVPLPPIEIPDTPAIEIPEEQQDLPDIVFEGIQFSFDPSLAGTITTAAIPGQNLGDDFMPSETYPAHFEFTFNQYAVRDHSRNPKILIFPVEDFRSISAYAHDQFNALQTALVNRPGGSAYSTLPYLPLINAAQLFSAQVNYLDFQNGSGVRYLTMHGQDIFPVDNHHLIYTYQGITQDGRYYISAVFPLTHSELPDDGADLIGENMMDFYNNWDSYLATTMRFLGEQPLDSFTPSIQLLDEMITSILIER
jgi:hypothetical protein